MDAGHKGKRTSRNETEWRRLWWPTACKSFVYFCFLWLQQWWLYVSLNHGMCRFSATLMWYGWWEFCNHKRNEGRPRLCSAGLSSTPERMYDFLLNHFYSLWINIPLWRNEGAGLEHWVSFLRTPSGSTLGEIQVRITQAAFNQRAPWLK